jgi:hypothetical protein
MPSGGYRKPSKPAPASGPGRLSRRTDGGPGQKQRDLPNAEYGEGAAFAEAQSGAALNLADGALTPSASAPAFQPPLEVTPFGAPTQMPGMPVTSGAALGAGPGLEALGLVSDEETYAEDRKKLVAYLPALEYIANGPNALPSMRALVRRIKASAGI